MNSTVQQHPAQDLQPYVRPHHFESEPVLFALCLVAVVMAISVWRPLPEAQQAVPANQPTTVAESPRG